MLSKISLRALLLSLLVAAVATVGVTAVATGKPAKPHKFDARGWVTSNTVGTLSLRDFHARAHNFTTNPNTKYKYEDGTTATADNAQPGAVVRVHATKPTTKGGNPVAKVVVIDVAELVGLVKTNSGNTMTIYDRQGFTRTIDTTGATCRQGNATVACSSIAVNSVVTARGHVDSDGTTLDATRIRAIPPKP